MLLIGFLILVFVTGISMRALILKASINYNYYHKLSRCILSEKIIMKIKAT